jgi:IS5 family transposase
MKLSRKRRLARDLPRTGKSADSRYFTPIFVENQHMRVGFQEQLMLGTTSVERVQLNSNCRDEIVPVLRGIQEVYDTPDLRQAVLDLIARDVNRETRADRGRRGLDYWQIFVLASVRLGCDLDYDKLQDLAENHRALRAIMQLGPWDEDVSFDWRRLRSNVARVGHETLERINTLVVAHGQRLAAGAARAIRVDTFVVKTPIRYPTDVSLMRDGLRSLLRVGSPLAETLEASGWRQHRKWHKKVRQQARQAEKAAMGRGSNRTVRMRRAFVAFFDTADTLLARAQTLLAQADKVLPQIGLRFEIPLLTFELDDFVRVTTQVVDVAKRRILHDEPVPTDDKIFSVFEPHTQLINRGKRPNPCEFGHRVLVVEDAVGFVGYYQVMDPGQMDQDVPVTAVTEAQARFQEAIASASFDQGFHTPENQQDLADLVEHPCLPKRGWRQGAEQAEQADEEFRTARRLHPGVESAIGALVRGNGLDQCRDRTYSGFLRFVGLAILGRNLHVLGKLLIQRADATCAAAQSKRQRRAG